MIALSEPVGLPVLLVRLFAWVRSDARQASDVDAVLDALNAAEHAARAEHNDPEQDVLLHRPWWEIEVSSLADRGRRSGWSQTQDQPHERHGDATGR